ncbi:predicted GPI-anchored protein 58 [Manduca sexta]|uniref:predicted GPI-anchored protein 58 n=1 Tax=Manduca sexta TaxID=7130 RepID=UPI0018904950|nr:predicted GPI-anchored protein 58 [Manduca sexta]
MMRSFLVLLKTDDEFRGAVLSILSSAGVPIASGPAEPSVAPSAPEGASGAVAPAAPMDSDPGSPQLQYAASKRPVSSSSDPTQSEVALSDPDDDGFTTVRHGRRKKQKSSDASAPSAPPAPSAPAQSSKPAPSARPAASKPANSAASATSSPPKGPKKPPRVNLQLPAGIAINDFFDELGRQHIAITTNSWNGAQQLLSLQPASIADHRSMTTYFDRMKYHYFTYALPGRAPV